MEQDLLQKYIVGNATEAEKKQVVEWLNADEKNMREFIAQRKLYDMTVWHIDESGMKQERVTAEKVLKPSSWIREIVKIAAILVIVIGGVYFWQQKEQDKLAQTLQTVRVPVGQRAELILADGTKVWLNSGTTLRFPTNFSSEAREVKLDGEGYFQVAKNEAKPFIVETDKYDIRVLGTEFNVTSYSNSPFFETALLRGSVEVFKPKTNVKMLLEPDMKIELVNGELKKSPIGDNETYQWREGLLNLRNKPVMELMKTLEAYYGVKIVINNKGILTKSYSGKFRVEDGVEHILKVLQLNNNFTYVKDEETRTIYIN